MKRRVLLGLLLAAALPAQDQRAGSIAREWKGTLDVSGFKLTMIFRISEPAPGDLKATLEVLEQKAAVPVRTVTYSAGEVTLDLPVIQGQLAGKLQPDGKSVRGTWKQAGLEFPLTLEALDASSQPLADTSAITAWVRDHAIRLKTVEARHGFDDMAPIKQVVGDARIVSVGEATHGTREFFQLKHRSFEFLVERMGFTVFAIEANMPEARRVNEYVLEGKGDPAAAIAGLYFWTWNTDEVLDLIRWMREYNANAAHTRKVKFYGFDMQTARVALAGTIEYLQPVDPEYAAKAGQQLAPLSTPEKELALRKGSGEAKQQMVQTASDLGARLDAITPRDAGWRQARQDARIVEQAVRTIAAPGNFGSLLRDEAMAANVAWILDNEGPDAKIMLWAHNEHVRVVEGLGARSMGFHLRQRFGNQMVAMGFAFNQGSFRAVKPGKGCASSALRRPRPAAWTAPWRPRRFPCSQWTCARRKARRAIGYAALSGLVRLAPRLPRRWRDC